MTALAQIGGVSDAERLQLRQHRILMPGRLLHALRHQRQRVHFSRRAGIDQQTLLRWANAADLMRIKGIGSQSVELLAAAGVHTVRELRWRNAPRLHRAMLEANARLKLVELPPALNFVRRWIAQARQLELLITY